MLELALGLMFGGLLVALVFGISWVLTLLILPAWKMLRTFERVFAGAVVMFAIGMVILLAWIMWDVLFAPITATGWPTW